MPKKQSSAYGELVASNAQNSLSINNGEDHVLAVLSSESLQYKDLETLVVGLNPQRAQDILMSYRILSTLSQYLEETNSWTFCLLNNYDFQSNVRQFDLDVAVVVGKRAEHLLAEIHAWNIPRLKRMVTQFSAYYSDEATILTVLVFRIVAKYSDLEFTLQLALSRATLIKIHYEMAGLFSKLPGGSESNRSDVSSSAKNADLVESYRRFVTQLLEEIESTPFESVQQELFQVVHDLRSMFSKFSDSQMLKSLEDTTPQESTFFDLTTAKLPPLAEEWQSNDFTETLKPAPQPTKNTHRRTVSNSTMFSSVTAASTKSALSEDLPQMMQAFDLARKREEFTKHHQHVSLSGHTTPPATPVRSTTTGPKSPETASMSCPSHVSSPTSSASTPKQTWASSSVKSTRGSSGTLGSALAIKNEPEAMQVKMVSNRMMIFVDGKFIDMQEWATKVNNQPHGAHVAPMPVPPPQVVTVPAAAVPSYGLGSLFQPWLRPAEDTSKPARKDGATTTTTTKRVSKSQSIDNILATAHKQQSTPLSSSAPPTSTMDLLRSSSMPLSRPASTFPVGMAAGVGSLATASSTPLGGQSPSLAATIQSSAWIKGVIGNVEDKFGKSYGLKSA